MAGVQIHGKQVLKVRVGGQITNLLVLCGNGSTRPFDVHPLVEEFNKENNTNLRVVSHRVADAAQMTSEVWRQLPSYVVDASIAYERPGTKLGKEIVFFSSGNPKVVLSTGKYKGEKDVALVALGLTSADFIKDENSIVLAIPDSRLIVVPNFPGSDGWYIPHAETGVPHGKRVNARQDARYLSRLYTSSYVGPVARGYDGLDGNGGQGVGLDFRPSGGLGVVVEVPEGDVAKIEALLKPARASEIDNKTAIEVPGISLKKLSGLYQEATKAVLKLNGVVDAKLLEPIQELLKYLGKARF